MTDTQTNEYYQPTTQKYWVEKDVVKDGLPEHDAIPFDDYSIKVLGISKEGKFFKCQYSFDFKEWYSEEGIKVSPPVSYLLPSASPTTSDTFSLPHLKTAWNAFRMRGFPHNTDSYGNETFEQFISSLKHK